MSIEEARTTMPTTRLGELLFVLFLGLKLGGVIDWSWWWVFAPIWIQVLIVFGIMWLLAISKQYQNKHDS